MLQLMPSHPLPRTPWLFKKDPYIIKASHLTQRVCGLAQCESEKSAKDASLGLKHSIKDEMKRK